MSQDEITAIFKAKNEAEQREWEHTRMICFYNMVAMNGSELKLKDGSTKILEKPSDLFSLPGDKKKKR